MSDIDKAFEDCLHKTGCDDYVQRAEYVRFFKAGAAWQKDKTIDDVINRLESNKVYDELDDLIADALIEHGPDGHCDGHEKITILALDEIKKALREGKQGI